jgi:nucleotide-binding universal stress UspA family protein
MKKILVAVDFSDLTGKLIAEGVKVAQAFNAKLILLHTEPPTDGVICYDPNYSGLSALGFYPEYDIEQEFFVKKLENDQDALHSLEEEVRKEGVEVSTEIINGDVTETILQTISKENIDLLVLGSHKHGFIYKLFFSDISINIFEKVKIPVLVVPEN